MEENNNLPTIEQLSNKVDLIAQSVDNAQELPKAGFSKNKITTFLGLGVLLTHIFGSIFPQHKDVSENVKSVLEAGLGAMATDAVIRKTPEYEQYG
jgi:hypothetical protein